MEYKILVQNSNFPASIVQNRHMHQHKREEAKQPSNIVLSLQQAFIYLPTEIVQNWIIPQTHYTSPWKIYSKCDLEWGLACGWESPRIFLNWGEQIKTPGTAWVAIPHSPISAATISSLLWTPSIRFENIMHVEIISHQNLIKICIHYSAGYLGFRLPILRIIKETLWPKCRLKRHFKIFLICLYYLFSKQSISLYTWSFAYSGHIIRRLWAATKQILAITVTVVA